MKYIKISLNKICYTYTALITTNMMFSLLNKCAGKFYSNLLLEQMIKILEKNAHLIVICPLNSNVYLINTVVFIELLHLVKLLCQISLVCFIIIIS